MLLTRGLGVQVPSPVLYASVVQRLGHTPVKRSILVQVQAAAFVKFLLGGRYEYGISHLDNNINYFLVNIIIYLEI